MGSAVRGFQLPIISIAPYLDDQSANPTKREAVSRALHSACVEYGFFYLDISQCVDPAEPEELTRLAREFFSLPEVEKDKIALRHQDFARGAGAITLLESVDKPPLVFAIAAGYQKLKENVTDGKADNHEGIDFYKPVENPDRSRTLGGENQWPTIPDFRTKYEKWIERMKKIGMALMEAMAYGLGMDTAEWCQLRDQVNDTFWVMRIIGYPPLPNDHDGFSCGAHKDYGCLTLLYADPTKSALQVFLHKRGHVQEDTNGLPDEHGGEEGFWINADPIPGCIVCNIGEMWEIWTNGLYKSTLHRVVHRGTNYRVSIPFFYEPNFTALVKPLPAALRLLARRKGHTPQKVYKPVVYGDFLLGKVGGNFAIDGQGKHD